MAPRLDNLGVGRIMRDRRTGAIVVDTDTIRRGGFAGEDFGDDWDDDDDDTDEDDFGDDDVGDDLEGDFEGEDDVGEDDVGEFGGPRRKRRRLKKRLGRLNRRESNVREKLADIAPRRRKEKRMSWGMTAVSGTQNLGAAGSAAVKIRLQHDFRAQDITFTGSAAGAKVTSIFFGDRSVWSSSDGIDVTVFGSTSFLRGLLKGQSIRAGLDITVNGTLTGSGDFAVTIIGSKPVDPRC
jgi:hypothetical protein